MKHSALVVLQNKQNLYHEMHSSTSIFGVGQTFKLYIHVIVIDQYMHVYAQK